LAAASSASASASNFSKSFPVMSANGHLEGIISREDIMRALKEATQEFR
jgi:CBS domain-containing protein